MCFQVPLEGQPPKPPALSPEEFRSFTVDSVTAVGRNTSRIRFALPEPTDSLGLTVASCLVAKAQVDGETVVRPYTPVTSDRQLGYFDLVVKGYEEGKLSRVLTSVQPGDQVEMKGPWVKLEYKPNMKKAIGMIAGGSGVTPMFQVIRKVLENPRDNTGAACGVALLPCCTAFYCQLSPLCQILQKFGCCTPTVLQRTF